MLAGAFLGAVQQDDDVFGVLLDVAPRAGDRVEAEAPVEAVLAVGGAGRADHRRRAEFVGGGHGQRVQVQSEAELAGPVLDDEPAVFEHCRRVQVLGAQDLLVAGAAEEFPGLVKGSGRGCQEAHVAQRRAVRAVAGAPGGEVPGAVILPLVVGVAAGAAAEGRAAALVEEDPGAEMPYLLEGVRCRARVGRGAEGGEDPWGVHDRYDGMANLAETSRK